MTNFVAEGDLIKKYKNIFNLLKAMGKVESDYLPLAKKRSWTTVNFNGRIEEYDCSLTFNIRLNKKDSSLEYSTPSFKVLNFPHPNKKINPAVMTAIMALVSDPEYRRMV